MPFFLSVRKTRSCWQCKCFHVVYRAHISTSVIILMCSWYRSLTRPSQSFHKYFGEPVNWSAEKRVWRWWCFSYRTAPPRHAAAFFTWKSLLVRAVTSVCHCAVKWSVSHRLYMFPIRLFGDVRESPSVLLIACESVTSERRAGNSRASKSAGAENPRVAFACMFSK